MNQIIRITLLLTVTQFKLSFICPVAIIPIQDDYECINDEDTKVTGILEYSIYLVKDMQTQERHVLQVGSGLNKEQANLDVIKPIKDTDYIVKSRIVHIDNDMIFKLLEQSQKGTLADYIYSEDFPTDQKEILKLFSSIVEIVNNLHKASIVHTNLKPATIIVSDKGIPRLTGVSKAVSIRTPIDSQTLQYEDPEFMFTKDLLNSKTSMDVWSLGVILYEMLMKKPMIDHGDIQYANRLIIQGHLPVKKGIGIEVIDILLMMLKRYDYNRSTTDKILEQIKSALNSNSWSYLSQDQQINYRWNTYKTVDKLNEIDEKPRSFISAIFANQSRFIYVSIFFILSLIVVGVYLWILSTLKVDPDNVVVDLQEHAV